jgi:hypothetical protein
MRLKSLIPLTPPRVLVSASVEEISRAMAAVTGKCSHALLERVETAVGTLQTGTITDAPRCALCPCGHCGEPDDSHDDGQHAHCNASTPINQRPNYSRCSGSSEAGNARSRAKCNSSRCARQRECTAMAHHHAREINAIVLNTVSNMPNPGVSRLGRRLASVHHVHASLRGIGCYTTQNDSVTSASCA